MYARSNLPPSSFARRSSSLRCLRSSWTGSSTPLADAMRFSSSFAMPWSLTIRSPNALTSFSVAFAAASCPASTSAMPPIAASVMNFRPTALTPTRAGSGRLAAGFAGPAAGLCANAVAKTPTVRIDATNRTTWANGLRGMLNLLYRCGRPVARRFATGRALPHRSSPLRCASAMPGFALQLPHEGDQIRFLLAGRASARSTRLKNSTVSSSVRQRPSCR